MSSNSFIIDFFTRRQKTLEYKLELRMIKIILILPLIMPIFFVVRWGIKHLSLGSTYLFQQRWMIIVDDAMVSGMWHNATTVAWRLRSMIGSVDERGALTYVNNELFCVRNGNAI